LTIIAAAHAILVRRQTDRHAARPLLKEERPGGLSGAENKGIAPARERFASARNLADQFTLADEFVN